MNRPIIIGVGLGLIGLVAAGYVIINSKQQETRSAPDETAQATRYPYETPQSPDKTAYVEYTADAFNRASGNKRVYFFWASWCPTCKVANQEFLSMTDKIPDGVILFKTNYDTETELKKKYGITYQHTFVEVDAQGNEVTKWNGGGIAELTNRTK